MDFNRLVQTLIQLEDGFRLEAGRAVNQYMTVRNWLMGFYIVEFEQNGEDRARYGAGLIRSLAKAAGRSGLSFRNLNLFRKFYLIYPHVHEKVTDFLKSKSIGQTSAQLLSTDYQALTIVQTSAQSFETDAELLLSRLSFSHLVLLMQIEEPLRRAFYELESIRGGWSVRELKRQMDSLLYERTGLSKDKATMLHREHEQQPDDNPPIGLLLCTDREETVVRYAIGGLDERIFVSQYRLHLPAEQDLKAFLSREQEHLASQQMRRTRTGKRKDK
jgi:hypothetical protein